VLPQIPHSKIPHNLFSGLPINFYDFLKFFEIFLYFRSDLEIQYFVEKAI